MKKNTKVILYVNSPDFGSIVSIDQYGLFTRGDVRNNHQSFSSLKIPIVTICKNLLIADEILYSVIPTTKEYIIKRRYYYRGIEKNSHG